MQIDLEVTKTDLKRIQDQMTDQQSKHEELSQAKSAFEINLGRAETQFNSDKEQIERLNSDQASNKTEIDALRKSEQIAREVSSKASESADKLKEQLETTSTSFKERIEERDTRSKQLDQKLSALNDEQKSTIKLLAESREANATSKEAADQLTEQLAANAKVAKERIEEKDHRAAQLDQKLIIADERQNRITESLAENRESLKQAQAQLEEKQDTLNNYKAWWERAKEDLKKTEDNYSTLSNEYGKFKASQESKQEHFDDQLKLLKDNKEALTKEFERLANEVLERKGRAFKELNHESITNLLNPIQTEIKGFKEKVEHIHTKDAEQRIELKTELKNLQKLNKDITDQADKLTTALQGQKKVQGNWGELMLENVLDNSGLTCGRDYKREVSFNTEKGRQRPDVIVYLPNKQHLIIDAKTSLAAYTQYVNADNELDRGQALAAHARAVSDRVNELSDRDYFKLQGLNSPEVVIMFIPIESAYVEALKHDETLFQRAIERNVLVATPTTLLTSMNIVRQLWRFEDQNKHTAELANRAEKFHSKLRNFLVSMEGIGTQLDTAKNKYDQAIGQLCNGKGNLIKQAVGFKDLGVSVQKELPTDLVERANLELGSDSLSTIETEAIAAPAKLAKN